MFVAAVLFAALAAALTFVALQERGESDGGSSAGTVVPVVVAARDIAPNTTLAAGMLEVRSVAPDAAVAGAYEGIEALTGLATRYPLAKGEQITPAKVGAGVAGNEEDVSLALPAGKRGIAVEVSEITGAGGLLLPGNTVDVIGVFDGGGASGGVARAVTLFQNVEVLAVGEEAQEPLPRAQADAGASVETDPGRAPDDAERQPDARTVTLAVTPGEAQVIALTQALGKIWLSLRPAGDMEVQDLGQELLPFLRPPEEGAP
jgi:pilus assembly protein CpaB